MVNALYQITAEYNPVEDRVLFRVNTREKMEYKIWLTRRLVKQIWSAAVKNFATEPDVKEQVLPQVKKTVLSMKHQKALQSTDFTKKHENAVKAAPEMEKPLLATNAELVSTKQGLVRLSFHTVGGRSVNLNLNHEMLHAVCHIFQQAADKAAWDLKLPIGNPTAVVMPPVGHLH